MMVPNHRGNPNDVPAVAANVSRVPLWTPSAVQALATRPDGEVVAVGRQDGDVELTVPREGYRVEARVPGQKGKGLRSLCWMDDDAEFRGGTRLFGCGLDGTVFEVDLVRLCYKNVRDAYGGAAWCMKPAPMQRPVLAVGCEDGSVRLFSTEGLGIEYKRSFPSSGSRVLSVAWGPGGDVLYAGCADSMIRCVDTSTGQGLFDMRLETDRKEEALVWVVEALSDSSVVSGDSQGRVQVWDGLTGTQLQSVVTHEADVLCLCVTADETELFASGCDSKVVSMERRPGNLGAAPAGGGDSSLVDGAGMGVDAGAETASTMRRRQDWEWSVGMARREHTHDVHALTIHAQGLEGVPEENEPGAARRGPVLVSAGIDACLALYSVPEFKTQGPRSLEPLPPVPVAFSAQAPRLVLIMHNLSLDVREIPRHARSFSEGLEQEEDGSLLAGGGNAELPSLRLTLQPKADKGGHLACAAFSADGRLVAVSSTNETKLYRLSGRSSSAAAGAKMSARRVPLPGTCSPPANALAFSPNGSRLIIAAADGDIRVVDLKGGGAKEDGTTGGEARLMHCFEEHVDGVNPRGGDDGEVPIVRLSVSASGEWLASASASGVVYVFDLVAMRHHWTVPGASARRVVGLRFHVRDDILVCVDSSSAFRLLDVQNRRLAACHENVDFPMVPSGRGAWGGAGDTRPLSGVAFNPGDPLQGMLLYNDRSIMYVTPRRKVPSKVLVKPRPFKKARAGDEGRRLKVSSSQSNFRMVRDFSSVLLVDFLGENELLIMENPWESIRESLPDALDRKQFGV